MKTYSLKRADMKAKWWVIDATDLVLGRLSSRVSMILRGKHKTTYTPHMDCGDHVVIVNAEKVRITGDKVNQMRYYKHTNHPGGIKETSPSKLLAGQFPERIIEKAVERMITRGPLGREQMRKLHVYKGAAHPHEGQQPEKYDFGALNTKNKKTKE